MYAADMDQFASGLFLVPPHRRILVPPGSAPGFAEAIVTVCRREAIDLVVPTVDAELLPLARHRRELAAAGAALLAPSVGALQLCLDKAALAAACRIHAIPVPHTELLLDISTSLIGRVVKPRTGSGARGVRLIEHDSELAGIPRDGSYIVQELLPGDELSVDVFVRADHTLMAAVPRTRDRIDSGVSVAGRTLHDQAAITLAAAAVEMTGLRGISNVQLKRDTRGALAVIEINPRMPGSLVLTAAAGANLAAVALAEAMGEPVEGPIDFIDAAIVRHLCEVAVPMTEYPTGERKELAS